MFSMFSAKTSDVFTFYVAWGREKAMLNPIWPSRLNRISRNAIWIGFQTTYECSSKRICTNLISCSSLPFRLFKYDRISIGSAQKSDLGWQSERGYRALQNTLSDGERVVFLVWTHINAENTKLICVWLKRWKSRAEICDSFVTYWFTFNLNLNKHTFRSVCVLELNMNKHT